MSMGQWLFSFNGRIGRGRYWAFLLVVIALYIVGFGVIFAADPGIFKDPPSTNGVAVAVYLVLLVLLLYEAV
jgi:uncharacterized membrane protein YhaH (DUF805 family)